jgi:hypothetical protein
MRRCGAAAWVRARVRARGRGRARSEQQWRRCMAGARSARRPSAACHQKAQRRAPASDAASAASAAAPAPAAAASAGAAASPGACAAQRRVSAVRAQARVRRVMRCHHEDPFSHRCEQIDVVRSAAALCARLVARRACRRLRRVAVAVRPRRARAARAVPGWRSRRGAAAARRRRRRRRRRGRARLGQRPHLTGPPVRRGLHPSQPVRRRSKANQHKRPPRCQRRSHCSHHGMHPLRCVAGTEHGVQESLV